MKHRVAVLANSGKLRVHTGQFGAVKSGPYELPFGVPHVLAAERWVEAFQVEPLYTELRENDKKDFYLDEGDEALCDECEEMFTVGDVETPSHMESSEVVRCQRLYSVCSEACVIPYVFGFRNGPSVSDVTGSFEEYTSVSR